MTSVTLHSPIFYATLNLVITMHAMEQFVQTSILLLLMTLVSVASSPYPYLSILLCGILLILFTARSLAEQSERLPFIVQILCSAVFAVISGATAPYLIFYECRIGKVAQLALPLAFYLSVALITKKRTLPYSLGNTLLLFLAALGLLLIETWIRSYLSAKHQITRAVSVTAVNEMYEKKLNQELVMKNYLADKTARLEERENISRNIHNSVGHSITAAVMTLEAADMLFDSAPDRAREKMNVANDRIRTSLQSIRRAVRVLDCERKFISAGDFIGGLTAVTDSFAMDTMLQIRTDFSDVSPELLLPHEYTEFFTGALQECLSNGVRHGKADRFTVRLTADSRHIRLRVSDNGRSDFAPSNAQERIQNGYGLKKLISYAKRCGGSADFANANGFQAVITLPLYEEGKE